MQKSKALVAVAAAALAAIPATATAKPQTFSLHRARAMVVHHERAGLNATVGACRWQGPRDRVALCSASLTATVTDGGAPVAWTWTDVVTRSQACPLHVASRRRVDGVLTVAGGGTYRGQSCYVGPLVVTSRDLGS